LSAARHVEAAARYNVRVAEGALLPSVDLVGQIDRSAEVSTRNLESDREALLGVVTVPLYQAGAVSAQIRQAKHSHNQRRIEIEQFRRAVIERTTQAWEDLVAARERIFSRREQVRAAEIALEGTEQEAAVG